MSCALGPSILPTAAAHRLRRVSRSFSVARRNAIEQACCLEAVARPAASARRFCRAIRVQERAGVASARARLASVRA